MRKYLSVFAASVLLASSALAFNFGKSPDVVPSSAFEDSSIKRAKPLAETPFLEGSEILVSHNKIAPNSTGYVAVVLKIKHGHHIQHRDPGIEFLIPTRVFFEETPGITFDTQHQRWPKPIVNKVEGLGDANQLEGEAVVLTPFSIASGTPAGDVTVRAFVHYQACDEKSCQPPEVGISSFGFAIVDDVAAEVRSSSPVFKDVLAAMPETAKPEPSQQQPTTAATTSTFESEQYPVWYIMLIAFLGGIILNVMPCVLPVISLKIFGFMSQAGESRGRVFSMGLTYAAGILSSFAVLALALVVFVPDASWGAIMQSPIALVIIAMVVMAFGLMMLGVYELRIPGFVSDVGAAASQKEGYGGAFFNGVLATVLATPCTGPFLASALGGLLTLPKPLAFLGMMLIGVGLALPYVLLSAWPTAVKYLPKPGNWMVTFKQVMGFILLAVVIWLLWLIQFHGGAAAVLWLTTILLSVGMGCWIIGKIELSTAIHKSLLLWVVAIASVFFGYCIGHLAFMDNVKAFRAEMAKKVMMVEIVNGMGDLNIAWRPWEPGLAERLADEGHTVYVDYTASWCLTCQTNKATVLHSEPIMRVFNELGVVAIKADITVPNPAIEAELRTFNRRGVPLNLIYPAGDSAHPIVLPEILTRDMVLGKLQEAGGSIVDITEADETAKPSTSPTRQE